jgi:Methyltransferase domain
VKANTTDTLGTNTQTGPNPPRDVEYLSRPAPVNMTDGYFELASLDHFWVRRRLKVFRSLAGPLVENAREMAEVGCGHGIVQRQIEEAYGRAVTGFDLNENGLKQNLSRFSRVCCYDVFQRDVAFKGRFDLIFLWDVLEHIAREDEFLQTLFFHLSPGGSLVVNVPAGQWAFSGYDRAAGHVRRYSARSLLERAKRNGLQAACWTYWGLPLLPALLARKVLLMGQQNEGKAYRTGFGTRTSAINGILGALSRFEVIPQRLAGTSLMAVFQRQGEPAPSQLFVR